MKSEFQIASHVRRCGVRENGDEHGDHCDVSFLGLRGHSVVISRKSLRNHHYYLPRNYTWESPHSEPGNLNYGK